jgi:tetratricopeptide (TPR) repeat protein
MVMSVLAGCATEGKVKPVADESPVVEEPVADESPVIEGPSVEKFDDGREGFIITEIPKMDEALRRDFDRAVTLLEAQDYGQAIELLKKVIEQSPGVTAPYIDIAIAYERLGKLEQAEDYLATALELFPAHPVASNEYGLLYRKTGRFAEAREMYENAITHFPEYYPVHRNLGILCDLYLNDPECALEHYEIYRGAMPDDRQVEFWIVDLRARTGRTEEDR